MIAELVSETFKRIGHTWKVGGRYIAPDEEDVEAVLDEAAKALYNEPVGAQFESAGLIVQKTDNGFDVFVYAGPYF